MVYGLLKHPLRRQQCSLLLRVSLSRRRPPQKYIVSVQDPPFTRILGLTFTVAFTNSRSIRVASVVPDLSARVFDILSRLERDPEPMNTLHSPLPQVIEFLLIAGPFFESQFLILEPAITAEILENVTGKWTKISKREFGIA